MCRRLLDEGARLSIYDPYVPADRVREALGFDPLDSSSDADVAAPEEVAKGLVATSAYDACRGAHALVVLTGWDEFANLDFDQIYADMKRPCFVFDGRICLPHDRLKQIGFQVSSIGKALAITAKPDVVEETPPLEALAQPGPLDY